MQSIQLTEPELSFITGMAIAYRVRRKSAIAKSTRKGADTVLEIYSLNALISKLEVLHSQALHSQALEASPQTIVNDLPSPVTTHSDVELPVITPVAESLG